MDSTANANANQDANTNQDATAAAILAELHEVKRLLHRLTQPVDVLPSREAARRIGRSVRTLESLAARGVFTDGRAPGTRKHGSARLYFADEIDVYRTDGEAGVHRLREALGRGAPATRAHRPPHSENREKGVSRVGNAGVGRGRRGRGHDAGGRSVAAEQPKTTE